MHIQKLASRQLLSASVVEAYPGYYEIYGTDSADEIAIAVSQQDQTMTLDGKTYYGLGYASIFGNGGSDRISVLSSDGYGYIAVGISGGDGDDEITVNFDGAVWGGGGSDTISVSDAFRGEAYGEGGDDRIYISGETSGAEIIGGAGNDLIDCSNNLYSVIVRGGYGDDTIYGSEYDDRLYGDSGSDTIYALGGNDTLLGAEYAYGGGGHDILYGFSVYNEQIEQFFA
jgi:Ca2+-binding RTX toxin-like protein